MKRQNMWAFTSNDINREGEEYMALNPEAAMDADVPLMFVSFPSAKDPEWDNHPGRTGK